MQRTSNLSRHESDKRLRIDRPINFPSNFKTGYANRGSPIPKKRSFNQKHTQEIQNFHNKQMGQKPSHSTSGHSLNYNEYIDLNSARPAIQNRYQQNQIDRERSLYEPQTISYERNFSEEASRGSLNDESLRGRFDSLQGAGGHYLLPTELFYPANESIGTIANHSRDYLEQFQKPRSFKERRNPADDPMKQVESPNVPIAKLDEFIHSEDPFAVDEEFDQSYPVEVPTEPAVASTVFSRYNPLPFHRTSISVHRNVNPDSLAGYSRTVVSALQDRTVWMNTARNTRSKLSQFDEHAELIVSKMEEDNLLMSDSPNGEQLRRYALRDMPQCLTVKRQIKHKLSRSLSQKSKSKSIGFFRSLQYRISFASSKIWDSFNDLQYTFELWYSTLRNIEGHFGSGVATHFKFFRWLFIMNLLLSIPCLAFIILPHFMYEHIDDDRSKAIVNNASFSFEDIFTGEGFFTNTILYYGFYPNITMELIPYLPYDVPAAYFFTILAQFIIFFLILSISMARSYRKNFIETKGGLENIYAHKIFCGWDFGISNENSAELKHSSIYNELKEILEDTSRHYMRTPLLLKFWNRCIQFSVHILVTFIYVGIGYGLWFLLDSYRDSEEDSFNIAVLAAVLINIIMIVLPAIFTYIMRFEGYKSPRAALYITLFRIFMLGATVIGVLLTYWMTKASDEACWETSFGQEIYRLVIFDFIFCVLLVGLIGFARGLIQKYYIKIGVFEFSIALYTMNLIYNQTLFWVGIYFAPLLSIIIVIKLFLTWYIRSAILLNFSRASSKSWRAAQTHTWFLILTFLSLLLVMGAIGFMMIQTKASQCGPFKNYEFVFEIIQNVFNIDSDSFLWILLSFIVKPGVVFLILLFMGLSVYYLRAKTIAQVDMVYILREMLVSEAKDKEFLLDQISRVSKGKWQYNAFEQRSLGMNPAKLLPNFRRLEEQHGDHHYNEDFINEDSQGLLLNDSNPIQQYDQIGEYKKYD